MRVVTAAFAIAAGAIVLLGYFFPDQLGPLRVLLLDWAVIIAGMAVLVGIFNLAAVHMEKFRSRQKGGAYGILLVLSLLITFFWTGRLARSGCPKHAVCRQFHHRPGRSLSHGDPGSDTDLCQHSSFAAPGGCDEHSIPGRHRDLFGADNPYTVWSDSW